MKAKTDLLHRKSVVPYVFLVPFILTFLVFYVYPIVFSFYMSLFDWGVGGPIEFRGVRNYLHLFTVDIFFWNSIAVVLIILGVSGLVQHLIALPFAVAINNKAVKGTDFFKAFYFLPYITSTVAMATLFFLVFDERQGSLNNLIVNVLGLHPVQWFNSLIGARIAMIIIVTWRYIGWNIVIYLTGLQTIPKDYYEAADIDGASGAQKLFRITLPLLSPTIFFALSITILQCFSLFDEPYTYFGYGGMGGPDYAVFSTAYYMMYLAFGGSGMLGRGSTVAWVLLVFILVFILGARFITKAFLKDE